MGHAALGDEVVDATLAVFVARVPVLHRGVLDLRAGQGHQLHHGRVQLVFVPLGRGAAFQVAYIAAFVGDDQGALELAGVGLVDTEVGGQLHGATHALGDVDEGAIGKHGAVQGGIEVIALGHHGTQVFLDQFRMVLDCLGNGAEDHARFPQLLFEGGEYGGGVEHHIHGNAGEHFLLVQGNAQFFIGGQQFRVHLVQTLRGVIQALGLGIVGHLVEVDRVVVQMGPARGGHFLPLAVAVQAPFEHPFRLFLLGGQETDDFLAQPRGQGFGVHRGGETGLVVGADQFVQFSLAHRSGPDVEYQSNLVRYYTPFVSAVDHWPGRNGLSAGSRWWQGGRPVAGAATVS